MDGYGQTTHMKGDLDGRRKNGFRGGGLLSLRSQSIERRKRRLNLTSRDRN